MGKPNKKGRSYEAKHSRLYHRMTSSPAWFDLSGNAVKVLIVLMQLENGFNNGELFLSGRKAAEWANLADKTAKNALRELEEHGFIAATERGHFQRKNSPATKWRLTWVAWPAGRKGPTNDWQSWQPESATCNKLRGQILPPTGVNFTPTPETVDVTGVNSTPSDHATRWNCSKRDAVKITPQTVIPAGCVATDDCNELRDAIRQFITEASVRQRQLAGLAGMSESKLSRFLDPTANRTLPPDQFNRLASIIRDHSKKSAAA